MTISRRILFSLLAALLTIMSVAGYLEFERTRRDGEAQLIEDQQALIATAAYNLVNPLWNLNRPEVEQSVEYEAAGGIVRALIVYDEKDSIYFGKIRAASGQLENFDPKNSAHQSLLKSAYASLSLPIYKKEKVIGKVELYSSDARLRAALRSQWIALILKIVALALATWLVLYSVLQRIVIRPLTELKNWISESRPGKDPSPPPKGNSAEIDSLAISFGEMAAGYQNYEILYRGIPLAVFIYDLNTRRFVDANPAACALLNLPADEIIGLNLSHFIPPALREAFVARLKELDPRLDSHTQQRIQDRDGRQIDVDVHARYIELKGRPLRLVMMNDITETRAAQEALQKSEAFFRALVETSQEATLLTDRNGLILNYYGAVERILGYRADERIGQVASSVIHPDDQASTQDMLKDCLSSPGKAFDHEYRARAKDGSWQWLEARLVNHLEDPELRAVVVTHRNVHARHESQLQLLRFERLAAIGQTAAGLAHEVRNPLAVITMCAEFLKSQLADRPVLHQDLDSIMRQSDRLKHLVNEVLERSKSAELVLAEAPAAEVMDSALRSARARFGQAAERIELVQDYASPGLKVRADLAQLDRVLTNLIVNAFQALSGAGLVTLGLRQQNACLLFEVSDNGPGIPLPKMAKIFEPFYTTKETGSGLGLWICKSIVEQHGGQITAENLKPRGCRFSVCIPL